jgi:hypothetical protein
MDRNTQSLVVTDLLAHRHTIALLHQRLAGCADVLRHRHDQQVRLREDLYGFVFRVLFVSLGMDTAKEGKRHR